MSKYEEVIPENKTYGYKHGASNASQSALLSLKHNNKYQNSLIGSGRHKRGGKIPVPSFVESASPSSPMNANSHSKSMNSTLLQSHENATYDSQVDAKPKQLNVSEVRGGRRSRKNRKSRRHTRRHTRRHKRRNGTRSRRRNGTRHKRRKNATNRKTLSKRRRRVKK